MQHFFADSTVSQLNLISRRGGNLASVYQAKPIGETGIPSNESYVRARVSAEAYNQDFLFRLVVYPSGTNLVIGIVERVIIENSQGPKWLQIHNLRSLTQEGKVEHVRDAPNIGMPVHFALDLDKFFARGHFPQNGYLGYLRGTSYPLPLDLGVFCFANTAILAGINHGKSHLASSAVAQLHASNKKVIILDPSGEWSDLVAVQKDKWANYANRELRYSVFVATKIPFVPENPTVLFQPPSWLEDMWKAFDNGDLVVLDLSLADRFDLTAEQKLDARCEIAYHIQQKLMTVALLQFGKTKKPYGTPTCIVLEEAHQFVPSVPTRRYQQWLSAIFSISTKEYRKYGSGHVFIDQSLKALHEDLQIQSFLLGATTQPADLSYLKDRLGENIAAATQRTTGGSRSTWVALGAATPMSNLPWEIESFDDKDLSLFASSAEKSA